MERGGEEGEKGKRPHCVINTLKYRRPRLHSSGPTHLQQLTMGNEVGAVQTKGTKERESKGGGGKKGGPATLSVRA